MRPGLCFIPEDESYSTTSEAEVVVDPVAVLDTRPGAFAVTFQFTNVLGASPVSDCGETAFGVTVPLNSTS